MTVFDKAEGNTKPGAMHHTNDQWAKRSEGPKKISNRKLNKCQSELRRRLVSKMFDKRNNLDMNLIKNILWNSCITIIKLPRTKTYFNETLIDIYMRINFTKKKFLEFIYLTLCESKFV